MAVEESELAVYLGSKVELTVLSFTVPGDKPERLTGKLVAIGEGMFLLKPSHSSKHTLLPLSHVQEFHVLEEDRRRLTQRTMSWPHLNAVRRHLVEGHGYLLSTAEALADKEATLQHNRLHQGMNADVDPLELGHRHLSEETRLQEQIAADPVQEGA